MIRITLPLLLVALSGCPDPFVDTGDTGEVIEDADFDGSPDDLDCDPTNPAIFPGAEEYCDEVDNDCDGEVDEEGAVGVVTVYEDRDGDGAGNADSPYTGCTIPDGYVFSPYDCNDNADTIHPGANESCNDVDDDCDGEVDERAADAPHWYPDADGDGWGDATGDVALSCEAPAASYVDLPGDCDDTDADIHPDADELCDTDALIDEDCDGLFNDEDDNLGDPSTWYADADQDGHGVATDTIEACEPPDGYVPLDDDCAPDDPTASPSRDEVCGDGVDNDCDDAIDEEGTPVRWYIDGDGDGYGDPERARELRCDAADDNRVPNGDDCNDDDPTVYPGAFEIWYDGVDSDCADDDDDDRDGDGVAWEGAGGDDCDDDDARVFPGALEVCDNGTDDDCDGVVDGCPVARLVSRDAGARAGIAVAAADFDGDGTLDPAIGGDRATEFEEPVASGAVWGFTEGTDDGDVLEDDANVLITGVDGADWLGVSLAGVGDQDGDAHRDLVVGAWGLDEGGTNAGGAYVLHSPIGTGGSVDTLDGALLFGELSSDRAGFSVASAGDVDGDGTDDILIGAYGSDASDVDAGAVYLVLGPVLTDMDLVFADARLEGVVAGDQAGFAVASAGDTDGDGFADLLVGAPRADDGGTSSGSTYLVLGPVTGSVSLDTAVVVLVGDHAGDESGRAVSGGVDLDDDGLDDVVVGAPYADDAGTDAGTCYVVTDAPAGTSTLSDVASLVVVGDDDSDRAGAAVLAARDVDGDGAPDLVVGAPGDDGGASDAGAAYLVLGPATGSFALDDADAKVRGQAVGDRAGESLAELGPDSEGVPRLLVGAPGISDDGTEAGGALLMTWEGE